MNEFLVKTSGLNEMSDGAVTTVMMIHGWGMNSQVWSSIKNTLEENYRVIWVDLPGHGFNRECHADNLNDIVDFIGSHLSRKVSIIGWSLGGVVAQAVAQQFPERINRLVLVASTPRFSQTAANATSPWPHAMSEATLERFALNLKQNTLKTLKGFIALQFIGVENAKVKQDALIDLIVAGTGTSKHALQKPEKGGGVLQKIKKEGGAKTLPTEAALDVGLAILKHADLRSLTPTWPEHWIFAEYDRLIPKEVINDLKYVRPNAQITLLKKAGHAPFITHRKAFLDHLFSVLNDQ